MLRASSPGSNTGLMLGEVTPSASEHEDARSYGAPRGVRDGLNAHEQTTAIEPPTPPPLDSLSPEAERADTVESAASLSDEPPLRGLRKNPELYAEIAAELEAHPHDSVRAIAERLHCLKGSVAKVRDELLTAAQDRVIEEHLHRVSAPRRAAQNYISDRDALERDRRAKLKARADAILLAAGIDPDRRPSQEKLSGDELANVGNVAHPSWRDAKTVLVHNLRALHRDLERVKEKEQLAIAAASGSQFVSRR